MHSVRVGWGVRGFVMVAVLALVAAACQTTAGSPTVSSTTTTLAPFLSAFDAGQLPDGTDVELVGVVVVENGITKFANLFLDLPFGGYEPAIALYGVDADRLDMFRYPVVSTLWSDHYRVSGTIRGGALYADNLEFVRVHGSRQMIRDCEAAVEHPDDLGTCTEVFFEYYRDYSVDYLDDRDG